MVAQAHEDLEGKEKLQHPWNYEFMWLNGCIIGQKTIGKLLLQPWNLRLILLLNKELDRQEKYLKIYDLFKESIIKYNVKNYFHKCLLAAGQSKQARSGRNLSFGQVKNRVVYEV